MKAQPFFSFAVLLSLNYSLCAQGTSVELETIFSSRMKTPVEIDVRQDQEKYTFIAINHSRYPYNLELKFTTLMNLTPGNPVYRSKILPGSNRIVTLTEKEETGVTNFSYSISVQMAGSDENPDLRFPYLIPVGPYKKIVLINLTTGDNTKFLINQFALEPGDTVYSIRKGYVTALPDNKDVVERIIETGSLEVRQNDGTIAVYQGISPGSTSLELGQVIFPGQPLGLVGSSGNLKLNVYEVLDNSKLKNLEIYFSGTGGELISCRMVGGKTFPFDNAVITREMTKKEFSRFEKGTLFGKEKKESL